MQPDNFIESIPVADVRRKMVDLIQSLLHLGTYSSGLKINEVKTHLKAERKRKCSFLLRSCIQSDEPKLYKNYKISSSVSWLVQFTESRRSRVSQERRPTKLLNNEGIIEDVLLFVPLKHVRIGRFRNILLLVFDDQILNIPQLLYCFSLLGLWR